MESIATFMPPTKVAPSVKTDIMAMSTGWLSRWESCTASETIETTPGPIRE
jgi:hypothetical protein